MLKGKVITIKITISKNIINTTLAKDKQKEIEQVHTVELVDGSETHDIGIVTVETENDGTSEMIATVTPKEKNN